MMGEFKVVYKDGKEEKYTSFYQAKFIVVMTDGTKMYQKINGAWEEVEIKR